ncbi:hypothetical protein R1flu_014067 [Riccia fluitans]|uniref:Uncharacterized protein n=1 Tax=Riccia fluitans TaxID=41844 RepID=A0ABD1YF27_9MARC
MWSVCQGKRKNATRKATLKFPIRRVNTDRRLIISGVKNMADASESDTAPCTFLKKSVRNKNIRKRTTGDAEDEDEDVGVVQKSKVGRKADGRLEFSTGNVSAKKQVAEEESKEAQKVGPEKEEKRIFYYESSREIQTQDDSRATATLETETAFDRDARAIRERVLKQADEALKGNSSSSSKVYKGINAYTDHKAGFRREHTIAGEKAGGAHGPLRASAHIRWSVRFDYQPDICKDYKETGYCGYGDSCKFMHDRGDYKSGWQMEKEWDESQKRKKDRIAQGIADEEQEPKDDDSDEDDELPFACFICRQPFKEPVMTHCKHYFCEHCALKHHARNKHCFVCNKPTNGVFNTAHAILKKMKEAKAAEEEEKGNPIHRISTAEVELYELKSLRAAHNIQPVGDSPSPFDLAEAILKTFIFFSSCCYFRKICEFALSREVFLSLAVSSILDRVNRRPPIVRETQQLILGKSGKVV